MVLRQLGLLESGSVSLSLSHTYTFSFFLTLCHMPSLTHSDTQCILSHIGLFILCFCLLPRDKTLFFCLTLALGNCPKGSDPALPCPQGLHASGDGHTDGANPACCQPRAWILEPEGMPPFSTQQPDRNFENVICRRKSSHCPQLMGPCVTWRLPTFPRRPHLTWV